MPSRARNDLDWLACRYALGDLPGAETAAFERLLDEDQDAREAVARAVELVGAVALVVAPGPEMAARPRRRVQARASWALAASVALAVGASAWLAGPRSNPVEADAGRLASAWSGVRDRPGLEAEGDDEAAGTTPLAEADPAADRPLPSWLVAGAAGSAADPARSED